MTGATIVPWLSTQGHKAPQSCMKSGDVSFRECIKKSLFRSDDLAAFGYSTLCLYDQLSYFCLFGIFV